MINHVKRPDHPAVIIIKSLLVGGVGLLEMRVNIIGAETITVMKISTTDTDETTVLSQDD